MPEGIADFVITPHAAMEARRRHIEERVIVEVVSRPDQRFPVNPGRDVFQSLVETDTRSYLVRVFVDVDRQPPEVVTVYRTGKIEKYWR